MSRKLMMRMALDIGMTILLFVCMSYQFVEQKSHEITGTVMFAAFILHHIVNWRWYMNLGKGRYSASRKLNVTLDFVILIDMLVLMIAGMRISGYVFLWMGLNFNLDVARQMHMTAAFSLFLLVGLHIGLHIGMIRGMFRRMPHFEGENAVPRWILNAGILGISTYGLYAIVRRRFLGYIFGKYHFLIVAYNEPAIRYVFDLLAIMVLIAAVGFRLQNFISGRGK